MNCKHLKSFFVCFSLSISAEFSFCIHLFHILYNQKEKKEKKNLAESSELKTMHYRYYN